jgi:hypothetical protein
MQTTRERRQPPFPVPFDPTAYHPATTYVGRAGVQTYKQLKAVLRRNPWIKTYPPRPFRLEVHAGDWLLFERGLGDLDPLEVSAETAERFRAEARAIRQENLRRMAM